MPQIKKTKTQKYYLPQYDGLPDKERGWVMLETPLRMVDFEKLTSGLSETQQQSVVMANKVKGWNFSDEDGKKMEVSGKNLALLDLVDYAAISVELGFADILKAMGKLKKKRSTSTS